MSKDTDSAAAAIWEEYMQRMTALEGAEREAALKAADCYPHSWLLNELAGQLDKYAARQARSVVTAGMLRRLPPGWNVSVTRDADRVFSAAVLTRAGTIAYLETGDDPDQVQDAVLRQLPDVAKAHRCLREGEDDA
jgi:hypothetical protein